MLEEKKSIKPSSLHLQDSDASYRLMVESVHDYAIFMLDSGGRIVTWNLGAERIKGYKAEEIIGKHFSAFYLPEAIASKYPEFELKKAIEDGRFEDEGWRIRKDGSTFWANVIITPIYNANHEHIGFSKVTRDLTERKKLEENLIKVNQELKASETRIRLLIEGVKDYAIYMLTKEGYITSWNLGAERIKGYKAEEIIGKHFSAFYLPEAIASKYPEFELKKAIEDGRFEDEGWRIRKDGSTFWANVVITPIYNANHEHIGYSKVTRDLTERIRNEELMRKNRELHKMNTDLDNFIYTASHDLKAPIVNLEGLITMLAKKLDHTINPSEKKLLEMMKVSIVNFNKTIANLTEITKVQKDVEESVEVVSFQEMLDNIKIDIAQQIIDSEAAIEEVFDIKEILFNRAYLRSIIYNLLTNAIKYRSPARPLQIKISTYKEAAYTVLSVKDNGLGLTKDQQSKLFSLYRRFHAHVEGSGTGLYLVKRIIENKDGKVEVESELEVGSEFKLFFVNN